MTSVCGAVISEYMCAYIVVSVTQVAAPSIRGSSVPLQASTSPNTGRKYSREKIKRNNCQLSVNLSKQNQLQKKIVLNI